MSRPSIRLFVHDALSVGAAATLRDKQAHYVTQVMRCKAGDEIALFNGADGEWRAEIISVSKKTVELVLRECLRGQESSPDVWLLFAPIKHGRIDYLVEKATELGVSQLQPVITRRTIVSRVNTERLLAHAIEAAEQCERLDVPEMHAPVKLESLLASWPQGRTLLYGDESGSGEALPKRLSTLSKGQYAVLIGPEGGFAPEEHALLQRQKFTLAMGLGPRVMRADTAALSMLACVQAWLGDWDKQPNFKGA